ncbi:MAG: GtrA family protein [Bacilli bacterium]|nr:GtrA family protein [Bacilli bacterium]
MNEVKRFLKFTFFSISAGLIQFLSFTILNEFTSLPYWFCYLSALVLSVLWNFTLNRKFTFKSASNIPKAMFLVFCYYLVFTPFSTLFGQFLVNHKVNEYIVTIMNMIINFITEFLFQRYVVFKNSIDSNK